MKHTTKCLASTIALTVVLGCGTQHKTQEVPASASGSVPFSVSVVPYSSQEEPYGKGISMAKTSRDDFYVVLTNLTKSDQAVFERWNSWGYQAISFELESATGRKYVISKKAQAFTVNFPSTFVVPPGEHMVYSIRLDDQWASVPTLPIADATPLPLTIRAIYEVTPSPEATREHVWVGRLQSKDYHFQIRHW